MPSHILHSKAARAHINNVPGGDVLLNKLSLLKNKTHTTRSTGVARQEGNSPPVADISLKLLDHFDTSATGSRSGNRKQLARQTLVLI